MRVLVARLSSRRGGGVCGFLKLEQILVVAWFGWLVGWLVGCVVEVVRNEDMFLFSLVYLFVCSFVLS